MALCDDSAYNLPPTANLEHLLGSESPSPKRQKSEIDGEDELSSDYDEEEERMIREHVRESEGFDIDFSRFRSDTGYSPVKLDGDFFVREPETNVVLLERLSREALDLYNQEKGTALKFGKVVKANWHGCAGVMFFITFEVIDPSSSGGQPILYQAKIRYFYSIETVFHFCRPKPSQKD